MIAIDEINPAWLAVGFDDWYADYFAGKCPALPDGLPEGTAFQRLVWAEAQRIPYGTTVTYGELARRIGRPTASRAVANALGANPWLIIVPCHRVVASDNLGGFRHGTHAKIALLEHENLAVSTK